MPIIRYGPASGGIGESPAVGLGILRNQAQNRALDLDERAFDLDERAFDLREQALQDVEDRTAIDRTAQAEVSSWMPSTALLDPTTETLEVQGNAIMQRVILSGASQEMIAALQGQLGGVLEQSRTSAAAQELFENMQGLAAVDPNLAAALEPAMATFEADPAGTLQELKRLGREHGNRVERTQQRQQRYMASRMRYDNTWTPEMKVQYPDVLDATIVDPTTGMPVGQMMVNPELVSMRRKLMDEMIESGIGGVIAGQGQQGPEAPPAAGAEPTMPTTVPEPELEPDPIETLVRSGNPFAAAKRQADVDELAAEVAAVRKDFGKVKTWEDLKGTEQQGAISDLMIPIRAKDADGVDAALTKIARRYGLGEIDDTGELLISEELQQLAEYLLSVAEDRKSQRSAINAIVNKKKRGKLAAPSAGGLGGGFGGMEQALTLPL